MKILTYSTLYPNRVEPNHGIFIQHRLCEFSRRYGHELRVVAPVPYFPDFPRFPRWHKFRGVPRCETREGVPVFHPRYLVTPKVGMAFYGWNMFLGTVGLVSRLRRSYDFSLIDAHYVYPDAFAAVLLGWFLDKPVIVSARGSDIHSYSRLPGIRPLLRFVLRQASAVIAVSEALKQSIVQLGVPAEKVEVIGNGVDTSTFFPGNQAEARHCLGLPLNKIIILTVAKIAEVKGLHNLIEAMVRLREEYPNAHLVVVGTQADPEYGRRLHEQVACSGLGDRIQFMDSQPHNRLRDWYNACDLFCLASLREGWPNVLLEAMACGKPIVASGVGGIPEVVSSPRLGILVSEPNGEALAGALRAALQTHWQPDHSVQHAKLHSWEQVALKQEHVFRRVMQQRQPAQERLAS